MKQLWRRFDHLSAKCYVNMATSVSDLSIWNDGFSTLMEIIETGRAKNPEFAKELYLLDEDTDYEYDVDGWLEDYMDMLDIENQQEQLQEVCKKLINLFDWKKFNPTDIRFRLASSMGAQEKDKELLEFCERWYAEESDNDLAATALIYARLGNKNLAGAEAIVEKHITDETECTVENDCLFVAAEFLYKLNGNQEKEKQLQDRMNDLEKSLEDYFSVELESF